MKRFDDVWREILIIISNNNKIYTLSQGKENTIEEILPDGLLVTTIKGKSELVEKEWIQGAWEVLVSKRTIIADDIPGKGRYRSSFIMALLSELDYIKSQKRPNTLYLNL